MTEFNRNKELVFNIWFVIDIGTGLSTHCYLKAYSLSGTDEEKTKLLMKLSETDFSTCHRFAYANINDIKSENNDVEISIDKRHIDQFFNNFLDIFLAQIELTLPPIIKFNGDLLGKNSVTEMKFSEEPLYVQTFLMENEYGEQRPYTTIENKIWAENEAIRIDLKSKSIQN